MPTHLSSTHSKTQPLECPLIHEIPRPPKVLAGPRCPISACDRTNARTPISAFKFTLPAKISPKFGECAKYVEQRFPGGGRSVHRLLHQIQDDAAASARRAAKRRRTSRRRPGNRPGRQTTGPSAPLKFQGRPSRPAARRWAGGRRTDCPSASASAQAAARRYRPPTLPGSSPAPARRRGRSSADLSARRAG